MVRSAAKNFQSVAVVTDAGDYAAILAELREKRELSLATRLTLARKAYARTARYDGEIATELERLAANDAVQIGELGEVAASGFTLRWNAASRCATARIPIKPPRFIYPRDALRQAGRARSNCREKSFPTTIWSISMRPGDLVHRVQAPRCCHHQAQQSMRRGRAGEFARSVSEGAGLRSRIRLWRRAGFQSPARCRYGGRSREAVRRMHRRARLRARGAREVLRRRKICGCSKCRAKPLPRSSS